MPCGIFEDRTRLEWLGLVNGFTSLIPLILACMYWNDCPLIANLPLTMVIFSVSAAGQKFIEFFFRKPEAGAPKTAATLCGLITLGTGIALAAMVFSKKDSNDTCNTKLFTSAVITAVIILGVIGGLCLYLVYQVLTGNNPFNRAPKDASAVDSCPEEMAYNLIG